MVKEYHLIRDTVEIKKCEEQMNKMAREGWSAVSMTYNDGVTVILMEREK